MSPAGGRVEVEGVEELARGTRKIADKIEDEAAPRAFLGVAERVASSTRGRVPRVSGTLAGSVLADRAEKGATAGIGGGVPYAGWIEFGGTRNRPYVPGGRYLFPAAEGSEGEVETAGLDAAKDTIRGHRW